MSNFFVKIYTEAIQGGHYADLDAGAFKTLVTIATFQNNKGTAFPSQQQIANLAGYSSTKTIRNHLKKIEEYRINGEPILKTKQVPAKNGHSKTVYQFLPASGMLFGANGTDFPKEVEGNANSDQGKQNSKEGKTNSEEGNEISKGGGNGLPNNKNHSNKNQLTRTNKQEPINKNHNNDDDFKINLTNLTSKVIINYFRYLYEKKYGIPYQMTGRDWGKFGNLVNKKVLHHYPNELIVAGIEVLVNEYDDHFGNKNFPRPSMWNFGNWVFQKAVEIAQDKEKNEKAMKERIDKEQKQAEEHLEGLETEEDFKALLDKMNNRNNPNF